MTGTEWLKDAIAKLDAEARRLLTQAAAEGRFDDLSHLTPVAKDIAALAERWARGTRTPPAANKSVPEDEPRLELPPAEHSGTPRKTSRTKKSEYPQFVREKDDLVKVGWSVRDKGPYEHRVPKLVLEAVVQVVAKRGKSGHRFAMDEIIKDIATSAGSGSFPSYQIYAAMSWLKWAGMVLQHGRQGYTVVRPQTFGSSVQTAWHSLPQR